MNTPISISPSKRRVRRKHRGVTTPTPAALTLVSAVYDTDNVFLILTFDRPVSIAAINPEVILVNDDVVTHSLLDGDPAGATLLGPAIVQLVMQAIDVSTPGPITMSATSANGIVAVGAGGAWPGVMDLALPFS